MRVIHQLGKASTGRSGFSLVEVMVVLVVVAVMAIFVAPEVGHWQANTRTKGIAREINSALQRTRLEAIKRNESITFRIDTGPPRSIQIFIDDGAGGGTSDNGVQDGTEEALLDRQLDSGEDTVLLNNISFGDPTPGVENPYTVITSRGIPETDREGSVSVCKDKYLTGSCGISRQKMYRVTLSAVGHLQLEKSIDGGTTWE